MHAYRTHTCGALRLADVGQQVRLSGWVHRKRDHGNLVFIDLRDHYGLTQCVLDVSSPLFKAVEQTRVESVVTVTGKVVQRPAETANPKLPTGEIELQIQDYMIQSVSDVVPLQVNSDEDAGEEIRLRYRFLDLRRDRVHANIVLRSRVISSIRRRMIESGFTEFQTPILTSSSPEGARDFLVPARLHPGKFYALPQAPQQFKQLLMVAGFDRYFQIAPCFRDEDSRADRSPGEFYQLDFEMSYVTQEDVFNTIEPVLHGVFEEFAGERKVSSLPFPRIPFDQSMLKYGSDKPDLRNPIVIADVTEPFRGSGFGIFAKAIDGGAIVRAIPAPGAGVEAAQLLRQAERMGAQPGRRRPRLHHLRSGRRQGPDRQEPGRGAHRRHQGGERRQGRRCRVLRLRQEGHRGEVRRHRPHQAGRGAAADRYQAVRVLLDRRLPDVRVQRGAQEDRVQPQPVLHAAGRNGRTTE